MKLKITLDRPQGPADLVLTAAADATVGDVATALAVTDPDGRRAGAPRHAARGGGALPGSAARAGAPSAGAVTLEMLGGQRVTLDPALPVADSGIKSGDRLAVVQAGDRYADRAAQPVAQVTVLQGPDAGKRFQLPSGNQTIGRSAGCDLRLSDTLVSRRHVRVFVSPGSAEILDLGSANGITLNDELVTRGAWLRGDRLRIGDTVLGIEFASAPLASPRALAPGAAPGAHAGAVAFNRSPVITGSYAGQAVETPELPEAEQRPRFPVMALIVPVLLGVVLYAATGGKEPALLLITALSPMMMVGNVLEGRMSASRGNKGSMAALRREIADLDRAADAAHAAEWRARNAEHPPTTDCILAAQRLSPLLWSRRPGAPRFLDLRVGKSLLDSRLRFETQRNRRAMPAAQAELDNLVARYRAISDVPFTLSLTDHGAIGIAGEPGVALDVTRAVLCQLAALHSPAELVLAAFCGGRSAPDWDWLKWLPHTSSAHSPLTGPAPGRGTRVGAAARPARGPGAGPPWCPAWRRHRRLRCRGPRERPQRANRPRQRRRGARARRQPRPRRPGQARRAEPGRPRGRRLLRLAGAAGRSAACRLHGLSRRARGREDQRRRQPHFHVKRGHRSRSRRCGDRRRTSPGPWHRSSTPGRWSPTTATCRARSPGLS